MASISRQMSLEDYIGSKEEAIAKLYLKMITTENDFPPLGMCGFYNLIIKTSNADQGTCFTDAMVNLKLIDECRKAVRQHYECGFPTCGLVFMKDIVNVSILKLFVGDGIKAIKKYTDYQQAFLALLEFLHDKGRHEQSIKKLVSSNSTTGSKYKETNIMVALAHHLFSQLIPGKKYEVDKYAKQIPKECGCGCKARICEGNTSVGSQGTWYGRVDILLNHTIAVAVKEEIGKDDKDEGVTTNEDDDTDEDEPPNKQRKVSYCDSCVEVKVAKKYESILLDQKFLNQILAVAITNGFAQINMNKGALSDFLIPTFGTTSNYITICLYDSENDYLLHIRNELPLWCPGDEMLGQLDTTTIVIIWLFLNFTIFTKKKQHASLDLDKSGLHVELEEGLQYYRKAETKGSFVSQTSVPWLWKYVQPLPRLWKE